ncbi:hypothetical protein CFBP5507_06025 [Agrobacterium salinitolerans]|uniref:Uncharacterized protein n=1 Tax=Agrobacterium salinitolerans TaxID=1183413 RepID=A0A4Z1R4Y6_9HYPH|nr:hypothetical protein [Agrobacterium salinitolerans]UYZ08557.1 hypothetical protein CFBP5507_06025 [Agrobacterium salinitolerans]
MKTLQDLLLERVVGGDQRAAHAVIDVRGGNVRILLGAIGDLGRIILSVDDNDVRVLYPAPPETDQGSDAADEEGTGERRPVDIAAGEFVDDRDPLHPGENPLDAEARIAAEGLNARQPEAVSTTTAVTGAVASEAGEAGGDGLSEIKNPQGEGNGDDDASDDDADQSGDDAGGEPEKGAGGEGDESQKAPKDEPESNLKGEPNIEAIDPTSMTKDQLLALAEKEGAAVSSGATKAEIAAAINEKRGEAAKQ